MYSANTMRSLHYALNRILKFKGHEYDIMNKHSLSFKKSQQTFLDSQKELKALGKGEIHSIPEITEDSKHTETSRFCFHFCFPFCWQQGKNKPKLTGNFLKL